MLTKVSGQEEQDKIPVLTFIQHTIKTSLPKKHGEKWWEGGLEVRQWKDGCTMRKYNKEFHANTSSSCTQFVF